MDHKTVSLCVVVLLVALTTAVPVDEPNVPQTEASNPQILTENKPDEPQVEIETQPQPISENKEPEESDLVPPPPEALPGPVAEQNSDLDTANTFGFFYRRPYYGWGGYGGGWRRGWGGYGGYGRGFGGWGGYGGGGWGWGGGRYYWG